MDFSKSVIMPREDFQELEIAAWDHHPTPTSERIAQSIQTSLVFAGMSAAFSVGMLVWYKLQSKLQDEKHQDKMTELDIEAVIGNRQ